MPDRPRRDHAPVRLRERLDYKEHEIAELRADLENSRNMVGSHKRILTETLQRYHELGAATDTATKTARHCVQALHPEQETAATQPRKEGEELLHWVGELQRQFSLLWWQNLALAEDVKRLEGSQESAGEGPRGERERPPLLLCGEGAGQASRDGWADSVSARPKEEGEGVPLSPAAEREARREREMLSWMRDDDYTTSAIDTARGAE